MSRSATIHATVDEKTKAGAKKILDRLGMSMSEAIAVYFRQIVLNRGLPFEIKIPNALTEQTFKKTDKGVDLHAVDSVDELFEELDG